MYTASRRPGVDEGLPSSPPLSPYQSPSGEKKKKKVRNGGSSNNQAMRSMPSAKGARGSISGKPMYETDGKEDKLCTCTDSTVNAQFHPQAVVVRTRKKVCCFPSAKSMFVLPRYKITDIQTGAGRKDVPGCLYLVLSASILLIAFGSLSSLWSECDTDTTSTNASSSGSFSESSNTFAIESCGLSGAGIFMIIAGCLLLLGTIGMIGNYCRGKDYWYVLEYSDNRQSSVTVWIFVVPVASISLLAVGANSTECSPSSSSSSSSTSFGADCYLTGGGIAMVALGSLLALVSIFLVVNQFSSKGKGSGSNGSGWSKNGAELYLASDEKPNEEFLYNYVYDSVEQTIDLPFLHRFNHLNRAGLMEAVAERNTPDELRTMVSSSSSNGGRYSVTSATSATDRDAEMAF